VADAAGSRVGIVFVSHSALIARGVTELAAQMAPGVRLIAAGGMADGSIGTDAAIIADAIARADEGAGVLVLADLGSAVLSTTTALELMVDPDLAARTRVCEGMSVAGAVAAAVQANLGSPTGEVLQAARGETTEAAGAGEGGRSFEIEVRNPAGLHGRSAANFATTASGFHSAVSLENLTLNSAPIDGKSFNAVMHSGTEQGHRIRVTVKGEDQDAAFEALRVLGDAGFPDLSAGGTSGARAGGAGGAEGSAGESAGRDAARGPDVGGAGSAARPPAARGPQPASASTRPNLPGALAGIPGAAGIAVGPVWIYRPSPPASDPGVFAGPEGARVVEAAADRAATELERLAARVRSHGREEDGAIFEMQALLAGDKELVCRAIELTATGKTADSAVESVFAEEAAGMADIKNELLAARAADYRDVGARIARIIRGEALTLPEAPSIAVAEDLPPSIAEEIPEDLLLGVAIQAGSATAHVVILSRGRGVPAVVGVPGLLEAASAAAEIAIDGETGEVVVDPDAAARAEFEGRAAALAERRRVAAALRGRPGSTADGRLIPLLANIGGPDEAARALEAGAEGVGLFRTEFLFMKRPAPPSEDEQTQAYREAFEAFGPNRPVVVRLADIGGDKSIPYLRLAAEANPFLGVRAIRLAYADRGLLTTQLRAIWRAGGEAGVTPHVMAPMVGTIADAELLLALRDQARSDVARTGRKLPDRMVTGVMVEIPSAALISRELARLVDFFSIGTNDLTQYTLAADRSNPALSRLQDALHPAVLRLIAKTVEGADAAGIPVAVCGELAGDPAGALVLVALGVDELSADSNSLDEVRAALGRVRRAQLDELAAGALAAPDARAVRELAAGLLKG
jgi:phosphoenolpyruvate-protein phosphotransferase/dihydroxyacetone kinase phosphotransfer subunit